MADDRLEGFKELSDALNDLGVAAGPKALRSAAMSASLPALKAAKAAAPVGTAQDWHRTYKKRLVLSGFGAKSVRRSSKLSKDKKTVMVSIGVKREAFYMTQFVELGVLSDGIPPRPWLRPTFEAHQDTTVRRFGVMLKKRIEKAAAKNKP